VKHKPSSPASDSVQTIGCQPRGKCVAKHLKPGLKLKHLHSVCMSTPIRFLFFSVSCLPQNLMLDCLYGSPTDRSLYDDDWMTLWLGAMKVFCSAQCWLCG